MGKTHRKACYHLEKHFWEKGSHICHERYAVTNNTQVVLRDLSDYPILELHIKALAQVLLVSQIEPNRIISLSCSGFADENLCCIHQMLAQNIPFGCYGATIPRAIDLVVRRCWHKLDRKDVWPISEP